MEHQRRADLMLLLATSFWGISNCLTAICLRDMRPLTLNAFRFLTAFVVLGFVFRKNVFHASRETVKYSIVVGLSLVVVYTSVTYGVIYTSVSNAGFICALSVVTTPILEFIVYRKKPEKKFGVSMILCLIGLALMTLNETLKPAFGDIICLFAAVFYSVDLMVTEKAVANEKVDPLALGVCDLAVVGVVMLMLSVFLETPALPGTAKVWAAALFRHRVLGHLPCDPERLPAAHDGEPREPHLHARTRVFGDLRVLPAGRAHRRQGLHRRGADAREPCAGGGRRGRAV